MKNPTVIIVDDQPFICDTIKAILKNSYDARSYTSGKEALGFLSDNPVDLVLLDYDMPGMTGYEVLMSIRGSKHNANTPVIFITAETNERMRIEMIERGASDYICKPIDSSVLHERIKKQLSV